MSRQVNSANNDSRDAFDPNVRSVGPPRSRNVATRAIALATLGSGLMNLYSVIGTPSPERAAVLGGIFPLEFLHVSRFITLLAGFALVVLSFNVYKRKKRAFAAAVVLACLSIAFHLTKGLDYEEASFSFLFLVALLVWRKHFTVKTGIPAFRDSAAKLSAGLALTLAYGIIGFWFLDRREFGLDFTLHQAVRSAASLLLFDPMPYLKPQTGHARWFLQSFYLITATAIMYGVAALFRPILYRYRSRPYEQLRARELTTKFGRTSLDFFKCRPDKSYFFSETGQSFIAYRVAASVAVCLGDPVGPSQEIHQITQAFLEFCEENDWIPVFYQTGPDYLFVYRAVGLHKLKIGDEAIVDLDKFSLEGKGARKLRNKTNNLEKSGIHTVCYETPIPDDVLMQAKAVSDSWLHIPGRRERAFSLGMFQWDYLKQTPVVAVVGPAERMLAFANVIPSYVPAETTVDLMRHLEDAPNGTMDYLFVKLFLRAKAQGFKRFTLGMAPMSGFRETEEASPEERAVHYFFQRMNFIFSYAGLMQYKAKFASVWEPRYIIFRRVLDLPRVALALAKVSELPSDKTLGAE